MTILATAFAKLKNVVDEIHKKNWLQQCISDNCSYPRNYAYTNVGICNLLGNKVM
jgi:hypothetical protein